MAGSSFAQDHLRNGLLDAAADDCLDQLQADRTNLSAYVGLAETYAARGATARALDLLRSVLELSLLQGSAEVLPVVTYLLHHVLPHEDGLRSWLAEWLPQMTPSLATPTQQRALCDLYLTAGRLEEANAIWERARHDPRRERLFGFSYAKMLLVSGKVPEGAKQLRRVVEADESDFRASALLVVVKALQSKRAKAWLSLADDLKKSPPMDDARVTTLQDILDLPSSGKEGLLQFATAILQTQRQRYGEAHRAFALSLSLLPNRTNDAIPEVESIIHQSIAELYLAEGKVEEADRELALCPAGDKVLQPGFGSLVLRAELLLKQGQRNRAVVEIDKARRLLKGAGQAKKLVELLLNVLREEPQSLPPRISLANLYDRWGYPAEAARQLETVAELQRQQGRPKEAGATYLRLARLYSTSSRYEPAVKAFQHYLELDPDNLGVRQQMFNLLLEKGLIKEAVLAGREMVQVCLKVGQAERATQLLQHLVVLETNDQSLFKELGQLLASAGRCREAIEALRRASSLEPADAEIAALQEQVEGQAAAEKV